MRKIPALLLLFYAFVVAFCGCKTNHTALTLNYPITTLKSSIYKGVNGDYITLQQTKTELLLNGSPYISKADVEKHYKIRKRQKNGKQLLR